MVTITSFSKTPPGKLFAILPANSAARSTSFAATAHGDAPFAPAARAYVLHYIAERAPDGGGLPTVLLDFLGGFAGGRAAQ